MVFFQPLTFVAVALFKLDAKPYVLYVVTSSLGRDNPVDVMCPVWVQNEPLEVDGFKVCLPVFTDNSVSGACFRLSTVTEVLGDEVENSRPNFGWEDHPACHDVKLRGRTGTGWEEGREFFFFSCRWKV